VQYNAFAVFPQLQNTIVKMSSALKDQQPWVST